MSHLCTTGVPCGLFDGHRGHHRTVEGIERRREQDAEHKRTKYATDPEWAQRQRDRNYWNLSGFDYNLKLLRSRRSRALQRRAELAQGMAELAKRRETA